MINQKKKDAFMALKKLEDFFVFTLFDVVFEYFQISNDLEKVGYLVVVIGNF